MMNLTLRIWRQKDSRDLGRFEKYSLSQISPNMSFLEMLDILNEQLIVRNEEPVAFDHDCREGICGTCSLMVNGIPHGPDFETTTCQLHMRKFKDGDEIIVEPWRAKAFPVIKDLIVDRSSFERIVQAGGFVSTHTGAAPEANILPISKTVADQAMDAAACIGCGACVAACKNASAMLFVSSKVSHLNRLPQGKPEKHQRALKMVEQMTKEGFGACTNTYECEAACPKGIRIEHIAKLHRDYFGAIFR